MKKTLLLIIAACSVFIQSVNAQLRMPASYGPSLAIAGDVVDVVGPRGYYYHVAAAIVVKEEFTVLRSLNLTASAGFQTFFATSTYDYYLNANNQPGKLYHFIPIKVGARYYITTLWYSELEGGGVLYTKNYRNPAIAASIGTGISIPIDGAHAFDIGARFENWSRKNIPGEINIDHLLALRLSYKIGI
jgi:hypothetical protein